MPATSLKQKRFFGLVRGVQAGKVPKSKVSASVRKAARTMPIKSVDDFLKEKADNKSKKILLSILKEIHEPMMLDEANVNPVSKSFTQKGEYDTFVNRFIGSPFQSKEIDSVNNYKKQLPSKKTSNEIKYETNDQFNNNVKTIIKKLKENNKFVYTAFQQYSSTTKNDVQPDNNESDIMEEEIIITKSIPFVDEIEGGKILFDFIQKLDI